MIVCKDTGDRDGIVARYGEKFVHGSLLAVRQDVNRSGHVQADGGCVRL
ncbi:hypothetical protein MESS4_590039 [Mesorhizobium sp. STM 4661]|nr:hypothetical protein MESS4_590039 [Mesorhizobium sp. STM 4661]